MLCERCGADNADVHLLKIVNGKRQEECVCRDCAKKILPFEEAAKMIKMTFSLDGLMDVQEMLKDLLLPVFAELDEKDEDILKCPHCGVCLPQSFFDDAEGLLKEEQTADPISVFITDEMTDLKNEMAIAVSCERYERAAEIRDRIKELGKNMDEKKGA